MLEAALHGKWPLSGVKGQEYATQTWSQWAMSTKNPRVIKALYLRWNSADYKWVQEAVDLQQKHFQACIFHNIYFLYDIFETLNFQSVSEPTSFNSGIPMLRIRLQTLEGNKMRVFTEFRSHKIHDMDVFGQSFVARTCKYEQPWKALWRRLLYTYTNKIELINTSASRLYWFYSKINKFGATSFDHSQGIGPFRTSEEHPSSHPIEVPEPLRESDIALCQYACCDALSSAWGAVGQRIWRQLLIASAQSLSSILSLGHSSSEVDHADLLAVALHN